MVGTNIETTGMPSPVPPENTRKGQMAPLPTPINVIELDKVLWDHPDHVSVSKLCSCGGQASS